MGGEGLNFDWIGARGDGITTFPAGQTVSLAPAKDPERPTHILVLDPALSRGAGHHFTASKRLGIAAERIGARATILCSQRARAEVTCEMGAARAFRTNVYERPDYGQGEFDRAVDVTLEDLLSRLRPSRFHADVVILPTCDQVLAKALARYFSMTPSGRQPRVLAWFLLPPDFLSSRARPARAETEAAAKEVKEGVADLLSALGDPSRLNLFSETVEMAQRYSCLLGLPVDVAPCPNLHDTLVLDRRPMGVSARLKFMALGFANRGKGYELLPKAIRRALDAGLEAEFFVHAAASADRPPYRRVLQLLGEIGERVTVSDHDMSHDEYYQLLTSANALILPYDPSIYLTRGSGIFNEAEALGIPTIVTRGCGFAADAVADGRSIAAASYSGEDLARAIIEAAERLGELEQNARAHAAQEARRKAVPLEDLLKGALDADTGHAPTECTATPHPAVDRVAHAIRVEGLHRKAQARKLASVLIGRKVWRRRWKSIRAWTPVNKVLVAKASRKRDARTPDLYGDCAWDVEIADPPRLKYLVAAMHRSGSNLMVRQLYRSEVGLPAEYFHPKVTAPLLERWGFQGFDDVAYVDRLLRSRCSRGLIWGCKLHWEHLEGLSDPTRDLLFEGTKVVMTRRRDLAQQALSLARALKSGRWDPRWPVTPDQIPSLRVEYVDTLLRFAKKLVAEEHAWLAFLQGRGLPVHTVWYEDYLADHDDAHQGIFDFLGVERPLPRREPAPRGKTGEARQDGEILSRLRERLHEILAHRAP